MEVEERERMERVRGGNEEEREEGMRLEEGRNCCLSIKI